MEAGAAGGECGVCLQSAELLQLDEPADGTDRLRLERVLEMCGLQVL